MVYLFILLEVNHDFHGLNRNNRILRTAPLVEPMFQRLNSYC